jgi:hypothetical protein
MTFILRTMRAKIVSLLYPKDRIQYSNGTQIMAESDKAG